MLSLRPYQEEGIAAVESAVTAGMQRPLIAWATGLGKTVAFAHLIGRRPGRALVLAHRDELLGQAREKLRMVLGTSNIGLVKAEKDEHAAPIVVASIQTLARESRRKRITPDFTTIVCDEAHHSEAQSYQRVFEHFRCFEPGGPVLLGVTATPERSDGKALGKTWEAIVHRISILKGIADGFLCDLRAQRIHIDADFSKMRTLHGDIREDDAEQMLIDANAPHEIAEALVQFASDRKSLVFTPTVLTAHLVAQACREVGLKAEALDGTTAPEDRAGILRRLRTGETQIVANCAVLTEGFDEPSVSCIVIARPTKSRPLAVQMIGRGTRLYPGKQDCLVLDLTGSTARGDLVQMADLIEEDAEEGLRDVAAKVRSKDMSVVQALLAVQAEVEQEAAKKEAAERRGRLVAQAVSLFTARQFTWVQSGAGFTLQLGEKSRGAIWLMPTGDQGAWNVEHRLPIERKDVWTGPSLEYAMGYAEDYAKQHGITALISRDAPWRTKPASIKQGQLLTKLGVYRTGLTAGEASDLITAALAQPKQRRASA
jgi:superfamily II DNA or RNA helicase